MSETMSILIAEDNVAQRRYLREILEREFASHAPVIEAGDGEETIELALKHRPELCVLDIQMPKLSGVKAARAIWKEYPAARIIFWTQFPHEIYINEIRFQTKYLPSRACCSKTTLNIFHPHDAVNVDNHS